MFFPCRHFNLSLQRRNRCYCYVKTVLLHACDAVQCLKETCTVTQERHLRTVQHQEAEIPSMLWWLNVNLWWKSVKEVAENDCFMLHILFHLSHITMWIKMEYFLISIRNISIHFNLVPMWPSYLPHCVKDSGITLKLRLYSLFRHVFRFKAFLYMEVCMFLTDSSSCFFTLHAVDMCSSLSLSTELLY